MYICVRVYSSSVLRYVYRVTSYCYVCMCMYTRVNICVLRDNDFSGITL